MLEIEKNQIYLCHTQRSRFGGSYSQGYGFSSSHYVCESWMVKKAEH